MCMTVKTTTVNLPCFFKRVKREVLMDIETLKNLVDDLYWEFDRMSSSGQKTLDEIAKIVGVPTNSEMDENSCRKDLTLLLEHGIV